MTFPRHAFVASADFSAMAARVTALESADVDFADVDEALDGRIDVLEAVGAAARLAALEALGAGARLTALEAIDAAARLATIEALNAGSRLTALEARPMGLWAWGINNIGTSGVTHIDPWWEGGTASAATRAQVVPIDCTAFALVVEHQAGPGSGNVVYTVFRSTAGGAFASTGITATLAASTIGFAVDTTHTIALLQGDLLQLRADMGAGITNGAVFLNATLLYR